MNDMNKRSYLIILSLLFFQLLSFAKQNKDGVSLRIWDNKPAKEWMTDAYPIGNGKLGGMVFGDVKREHIQFNESSLWTGDEKETGAYQAFGDLFVDFLDHPNFETTKNYKRELDINHSIHRVSYENNGIEFSREYFLSYPDQVMILNFSANKKGAYSAIISLKDAHGSDITHQQGRLEFNGSLENGLAYSAGILLKNNGGEVEVKQDESGNYQIHLNKVDSFSILLSAATDYLNERSKNWKGEDPKAIINKNLLTASKKNYAQLKRNHIKDYQSLFSRVSLSLGHVSNDKIDLPTFQRVINYKQAGDTQLEGLLFQYGRYLLISSSRKGGLPANLQGLWNNSNNPPWRSDYHSNINIQMNYWLAEPTNLSECHIPYLEYINSMRGVKKESTKVQYPGVRGWTVKTENNIFGGESFSWNTPGSAWFAQALWEHYAFTQDKSFLKSFGYPIIKEISEFWDDHLKRRDDGTIVAPMGWSPEHGPTEDGVSHDQQIVYDLFTNYIEAADSLGVDRPYRDHIAALKEKLLKPKIGKWGQLQEWEEDRDDPEDHHRHVSHLFALHPGRQISISKTPELAKAARVSLTARGDESTGWSMAWKMNFWARLHDGDHAYKILKNFITLVGGDGIDYDEGGGVYANLLCAHPPFQIDGNLGYTAGVAEMLVQSQDNGIELLPALPKEWDNGQVKGLKARGNFEISNMQWKDGKIIKLSVKSLSGGICNLTVPNDLKTNVRLEKSANNFILSFHTVAGKVYEFEKK